MKKNCTDWSLPFDGEFLSKYGDIRLTGNSGRNEGKIELRPRSSIPTELTDEIGATKLYGELYHRLGYNPEI